MWKAWLKQYLDPILLQLSLLQVHQLTSILNLLINKHDPTNHMYPITAQYSNHLISDGQSETSVRRTNEKLSQNVIRLHHYVARSLQNAIVLRITVTEWYVIKFNEFRVAPFEPFTF